MALPAIIPLAGSVLAGVGLGEIVDAIFTRRERPVQAVQGLNITRLVIVTVCVVALYFVVRNITGRR